jgi:hypothetical protein
VPAGPAVRVVGVVGDGERRDDDLGDDGAVVGAQQINVGGDPLIRIVDFILTYGLDRPSMTLCSEG